jgi:cell division septum initiation protein DivIVA
MDQDDKRKQPLERDTTDESLRTERRKTDVQLAGTLENIKQSADDVVAEARNKADSVLSDARDREDRKLADEGSSDAMTQGLEDTRARVRTAGHGPAIADRARARGRGVDVARRLPRDGES